MTRLVFVLMTMTAGASALIAAPAAQATTYYIGNFTKCAGVSCPAAADDGSCGASHPCATLAYWSQNRRSVLATGDTVRLTGVFGPSSNSNHCIMPTNAANVTYEGRNADDTSATGFGAATIDASGTPNTNPCWNAAVWRGNNGGQNLNGFTIRNMTMKGGGGSGATIVLAPSDATYSGIVVDTVRVTGGSNTGLWLGPSNDVEDNPCGGNYPVRDAIVRRSQFDLNSHYGVWFACVGGASILETSRSFHNCEPAYQSANCSGCQIAQSCISDDGMHIAAAGTASQPILIQDNEVFENGEDGIDVSGNGYALCDAPAHDVVVQRNQVHDHTKNNLGINHCNHDVTFRNNFIWGRGGGIEGYECPWNINVYNNTFSMQGPAIRMWEGTMKWDIANNLMRTTMSSPTNGILTAERASINPTHKWRNNLLVPAAGANAVGMNNGVDSSAPPGCKATGDSHGFYCPACPRNDPQFYCYMSGNTCPAPQSDTVLNFFPIATTATGQASFENQCASGHLFAGSTCTTDPTWGQLPKLVDPSNPSPSNLSPALTDTVAKGAGVAISSVTDDFFKKARPASPTIGASEIGSSLAPPSLISVEPVL